VTNRQFIVFPDCKKEHSVNKFMKKINAAENNFSDQVNRLAEGLFYISETDAAILSFEGGKAQTVSAGEILRQTAEPRETPVEERNFEEMFSRLTKIRDWFGEEETENARRFLRLKNFLEQNLRDMKVFKVGRIQLKIYFVGLDAEGFLKGIQTEAVET
jgi:hypothetical protein